MGQKKKVLIIAYYWPPAGGPGVQRWLKFVKYLPEFGIEPIVLVPDAAYYPTIDSNLSHEVSPVLEVHRVNIKEPSRFLRMFWPNKTAHLSDGGLSSNSMSIFTKLLVYIRGNCYIPDARVGWVNPAFAQVQQILQKHPDLNTIITTGPPHSLHLIGLKVKAKYQHLRWIADFRDPWTAIKYHKNLRLSGKSQIKHKSLEREVLMSADQILTSSWHTANSFKSITNKPVEVLTNGFDPSDFDSPAVRDDKFSMTHVGALLPDRNPVILWQCIYQFLKLRPKAQSKLEIRLVGAVDQTVINELKTLNLMKYTTLFGVLDHKSAVSQMMNSKLLFLVESENHVIPGKLFEYLNTGNIIAAVTPDNSDVSSILTNYPHSFMLSDDLHQNCARLCAYYDQFEQGLSNKEVYNSSLYDRKSITSRLVQLLIVN
ncbi:MAG: glycosyl transferase family 1 [Flavobacteriaceae bacterium]|jgi:hypothetical protein|nr:glycosyl transferase family 1 [Flavobacteriaceae bacterium]